MPPLGFDSAPFWLKSSIFSVESQVLRLNSRPFSTGPHRLTPMSSYHFLSHKSHSESVLSLCPCAGVTLSHLMLWMCRPYPSPLSAVGPCFLILFHTFPALRHPPWCPAMPSFSYWPSFPNSVVFCLVALILFLPLYFCVLVPSETGGNLKAGASLWSPFWVHVLCSDPQSSQCGLGSRGISITQELVRNAES